MLNGKWGVVLDVQIIADLFFSTGSVSYTHLDVYKRQISHTNTYDSLYSYPHKRARVHVIFAALHNAADITSAMTL